MPDIFVSNNAEIAKPIEPPNQATQVLAEKEIIDPNTSPVKEKAPHLLTTFCLNPSNIKYKDLEQNDRIILFLRKHLITNFLWVLEGIGLILIPFIISFLLNALNINISFFPTNFIIFSLLFYYLLVFQFFFLNFMNWFFNISFVTKYRVLDIDFRILFSKNVASTKISQLEDVTLNEVGILRAIFDYGDVLVQTAGTQDNFDFEAIPHPEQVVHIIGDLIGEHQHV